MKSRDAREGAVLGRRVDEVQDALNGESKRADVGRLGEPELAVVPVNAARLTARVIDDLRIAARGGPGDS